MTTITRAKLSEVAAERTGLNRAETASICDQMFEIIGSALMQIETVKMTAFGSLQVRSRAERVGRNPRTGTAHRILPRHTVVFTPSAQLREKICKPVVVVSSGVAHAVLADQVSESA